MALHLAVIVHPGFPLEPPAAPEPVDWASRLPVNVLHLVAAQLGHQDLCRFEAVCKACRHVAQDQSLWRQLCTAKFIAPSTDVHDWRAMYKFHHTFFYRVLLSQAAQGLGRLRAGAQPLRLAVMA